MELKLNKDDITTTDIISLTGEQSIESDILLPDYYEDIMKILKCSASIQIIKRNILGDKVSIDGIGTVRVYYQSVDNKLKSIQSKVNFTKTFYLKSSFDNAYIKINTMVDYLNCRAINERRIDVKGAATIRLQIFSNVNHNVINRAVGDGLQTKKENVDNTIISGSNDNQFTIKETIELPDGKPDINNIIHYEIIPKITDQKIVNNKVICKGEMELKILYTPFNGDDLPIQEQFKIPINQIVDIKNMKEDCECESICEPVFVEIVPKADQNGRNRFISVEIGMNLSTKTHSVQTLSLITDAYSTLMDSEYKSKTSNCYTLFENVDKDFSVEDSLQTPFSSKVTILDVWNTPKIVSIKADNDKIDIDGKTEISVLAVDGDNIPAYFEKSVNFNVQLPIEKTSNKGLEFDIDVYTKDIEYDNLGDKIDVKLKLGVRGSVYKNCVHNIIHDIKTNPNQPKTREEKESVIIYYSQPGEDLWQIAKRYNTSMDALLQENENIDFDHDLIIKDKSILLIPIVSA